MQSALGSAGGFVWWYLDLVDSAGNGAVLIWSYGLPFLPGSRERRPAVGCPGVNLAVYQAGRPRLYLLNAHRPHGGLGPEPDGSCRIGASRFEVVSGADGVSLRAELDEPVPGSKKRLLGSIDLAGPACRVPTLGERAAHCWSPLAAPSRGHLRLSVGGEAIEVAGRAYFDSNASLTPLDALGIEQWRWGRVALPDRELIYYLVDPQHESSRPRHLVLTVDLQGRVRHHADASCSWSCPRRSLYGLSWQRQLRIHADGLDATVRLTAPIDNGPFYLRFLAEGHTAQGQQGTGVAELVAPGRIDRSWQRPFVRMRTHQVGGHNSLWLPLFSGPSSRRLGRLARHWLAAPARAAE